MNRQNSTNVQIIPFKPEIKSSMLLQYVISRRKTGIMHIKLIMHIMELVLGLTSVSQGDIFLY